MTHAPDRALVAPLAVVAQLRRRRTLLATALAAGLAFFGTLLVGAVLAWQGGGLPQRGLLALAAAAVVAGIGALAIRRQRGSADALAFDVDRLAGLEQRFGTAVEVSAAEDPAPSPVALALRRAGLRDAGALDPRRLVPLATRPIIAAAVALLAILIALPLLPGYSPEPEAEATLAAGPSEEDSLRETLEEVARLLEIDAQSRDDPYLAAVSQALTDRLAAEGSEAELRADVAELLEHAARAYGERIPEWLGAAEADRMAGLESRVDNFKAEQARREARANRGNVDPEFGGFRDEELDDYGLTAAGLRDEPSPGLSLEGQPPPPGAEEPGEGVMSVAGEMPPGLRRLDPSELQLAGNMPSGAAMNSGRGESNAAGLGAETLEPDAAFIGMAAAPGEDVVLTATPQSGGRRIRIELAPEAGDEVAAGAAGAPAATRAALAADALPRQFVPADRRDVTARYFARAPQ